MAVKENKTASYKIIRSDEGNVYCFYCDLSGALLCKTKPYKSDDEDEELYEAWMSEGREHFNLCHKCGKWVIDVMYNPDVFNCVKCSPIEDIPDYCPMCGEKTDDSVTFCRKCGARLMYGGESDEVG